MRDPKKTTKRSNKKFFFKKRPITNQKREWHTNWKIHVVEILEINRRVMETYRLVMWQPWWQVDVYWQMCSSRTDDVLSGLSPAGHLFFLRYPTPHLTPFPTPPIWYVIRLTALNGAAWLLMGWAKTPLPEWLVTSNMRMEVIGTCIGLGGGLKMQATTFPKWWDVQSPISHISHLNTPQWG